jgi:nucleotide sugar dehydrogenase
MIGTGYVGLVSGACFADFGHHVTCVDMDAAKIAALQRNEIPIYEPGLDRMVETNARQGRLEFTTDLKKPVIEADAVFIAVGTPSRRGDGHADLSYVHAAAREIAGALAGFTVVVTKSTVPVGTSDDVERIIQEARPDAEFAVVSNPEFLREGAAIQDFKHPDRIVIGTDDPRARQVMAELYRPLYLNQAPILYTGRRTAELIKYAANAFLATKITFINEIADLCERLGADVQEVARGIGSTTGSDRSFCTPDPVSAAPACPRISSPWSRPRRTRRRRCAWWKPSRPSTTRASGPWPARSRPRSATYAARRLRSLASPSNRTPTTCARRPRFRWSPRCRTSARGCAPMTRSASNKHVACLRTLRFVMDRIRAPTVPTRSLS